MSELLTAIDDHEKTAEARSGSAAPPIRPTDGERLMRFWRQRDEAALTELIEQHAGMVWGVCSQILRRREDVEDAFQATFLILARKAKSIRAAESAAGWLYRVAFRTALLARSRRLRMAEQPLVDEPSSDFDQLESISRNEQCRVLLEELNALPLQYRQPLVLCYLEGRSRSEAAEELGVTPQSVKGRLARGTRMLRSRLVSRGTALSTTMAALGAAMTTAQAAAPPELVLKTATLGAGFAMKLVSAGSTASAAKGGAALLAEKGILSMTLIAAAKPAVAVLGVCLTAGMLAVATADGPGGNGADAPLSLLAMLDADEDSADSAEAEAEVDAGDSEDREGDAAIDAGADDKAEEVTVEFAPVAGDPLSAIWKEKSKSGAKGVIAKWGEKGADLPGKPQAVAVRPPGSPADVLVEVPAGGTLRPAVSVPLQPGVPGLRALSPVQPVGMHFDAAPAMPATAASEQSLRLQEEYWSLKSSGLKKKAEALQLKTNLNREANENTTGAVPEAQILETEAEAELALAEVKLCEINSLQVGEQLKAIEASRLKSGSKGVQVNMLQQALNERLKPSPALNVDGDFGPLTEEAVKLFQKNHGLKATGVVDAKTASMLGLPAPGAAIGQNPYGHSDVLFNNKIQLTRQAAAVADAKKLIRQVGPAPITAKGAAVAAAGGGGQGGLPREDRAHGGLPREDSGQGGLRRVESKIRQLSPQVEQEMSSLRAAIESLQGQLESIEKEHKPGESDRYSPADRK